MTFFVLPNITNKIDINSIVIQEGKPYIYKSKTLQKYLSSVKEKIDHCPEKWDIYKKYTNPYEYIQTPIPNENISISSIKPLSRSYFKMIEILNIHHILAQYNSDRIKSFHLAEGPGGFIEALLHSRNNKNDLYYGITLVNNKVGIPGWSKSTHFLNKHKNVIIEHGKDQTGNLYNIENLEYCIKKYGNSMDIITGDGGFDFSVDFNQQESTSTRLLFSQICFALSLQKKGGVFILKIFDCFNRSTLDLIYIVYLFYEHCYITKPLTSRVANSERYMVCCNFKYSNTDFLIPKWKTMYNKISSGISVKGFLNTPIPYFFISKMEEINLIIGKTQIENILYTIRLIHITDENERNSKINNIKKKNIEKCIAWCIKYKIPNHNKCDSNIFLTN